jgi:hypothetical protein
MNHTTKSILDVVILAISNLLIPAAQAGPGPHGLGTISPRPIAMCEVTMSCPRCRQPVQTVGHRAAWARKSYAEATAAILTKKVTPTLPC